MPVELKISFYWIFGKKMIICFQKKSPLRLDDSGTEKMVTFEEVQMGAQRACVNKLHAAQGSK